MEIQEFCKICISAFTLLASMAVCTGGRRGVDHTHDTKQCTTPNDIPVIKVTSYTTVVPLEDPSSNNIIFSSYSMARRLLKEPRPVRNVSEEHVDICLGEGGLKEWSVPVSTKSSFISELVIECFDQGLGLVQFEYNGIGNFQVGDHEEMSSMQNATAIFKHLYMPNSFKLVFKNISDQISGNYRSVDYPHKVNYFQLFVPMDNGRPYLIQRGKTINVTQDRGSSLVTLPCISNSPDAKVYLFKKFVIARMGIVIVKYQHQAFHVYDPKTGFLLNTQDVGVDPFGVYVCTSNPDIRDPSDRIRINLLPPAGVSRKGDGHHPTTLLDIGSQFMRDSYKRLRDIVNSFFI